MSSPHTPSISALVFDGDREVHQLVHCLCRDLQIKSFHFLSGAEAIGFYQQKPVEIVVAEVGTQAVNGLTLAKRIRSSRPQTPILLLVSAEKREQVASLEAAAGLTLIPKPIDPLQLARHLSEAVDHLQHCSREAAPLETLDHVEPVKADEAPGKEITDLDDLKFELESAYALIDQMREQSDTKESELKKLLLQNQKMQRMLQDREAEIKRVQQVLEALQNRLELLEQQKEKAATSASPATGPSDEAMAERLAYIEESEERLMQRAQELFEKETELAHREESIAAREGGAQVIPMEDLDASDEWADLDMGFDEDEPRSAASRRVKGKAS